MGNGCLTADNVRINYVFVCNTFKNREIRLAMATKMLGGD